MEPDGSRLNLPPGPDSNTQNEAETLRALALSTIRKEPNEGGATATRASIRAANLKAAAALKGDLMDDALPSDPAHVDSVGLLAEASTGPVVLENTTSNDDEEADMDVDDDEVPAPPTANTSELPGVELPGVELPGVPAEAGSPTGASENENGAIGLAAPRGLKRKRDEIEDEESSSDDVAEESSNLLALKVNPDGSVEQVDSVRYVEYSIYLLHDANQSIGYGSLATRSDTIGRSSVQKPVMTSYGGSEGARRLLELAHEPASGSQHITSKGLPGCCVTTSRGYESSTPFPRFVS
jgi:hypothetical protein